ncbi:hypothetical protein [Enterococcus casseliflavus]|uniref:hypothetical protein n=1 Tax=Enterococcus casseliflavus TaxID=37734 RepID=UPI001F382329|nr:hypothetical protein [Enterococcus casseliflavus]
MNPADVKEEILQAAQAYLDTGEIPYLPYQGYQEYLESGNRVVFESHYFARRRMLVVLGLAYEIERKAAIKVLLEQVIWEICNEYTWCLPAHLPIVDGQFSSQARHTVDLFAAETGQSLAELFMLVGGDLSPVITERVLYEIDQRLFFTLRGANLGVGDKREQLVRSHWWLSWNDGALCIAEKKRATIADDQTIGYCNAKLS